MYNQINSNKRRSLLLMTLFVVLIILLGYVFGELMQFGYLGVAIAVMVSVLYSFFGYYYSDKLVLSISGAKLLKREENKEIYRLVENLAITAGLKIPKIYIIQDSAPNAFATGRNPENAALALTTGLVQKLEKVELEGVIAHELSHIKNYDIRLMTIAVIFVGIVTLLSDFFLRWSFFGGRSRSNKNNGQLQLVLMISGIVLAILSPLIASLLNMSISRKREYLADASAALLTRYPEGLARALEKISKDPEPLETANKATAHLYISNPLKSGVINKLFSTHPPIEDRIKLLREMV